MRPTASSWLPFGCGDSVARRDDPRHEGRVEFVDWGRTVKVRWRETRWLSHEEPEDLVLVAKARCALAGGSVLPSFRTVVESPRRQLERLLRG